MKLMDTSSIILFLEFISEYEFLIKFSETGEVMIITAQVEEEYNEKKDSSIQNPNYNLNKLIEIQLPRPIEVVDCELFSQSTG